MLLSRSMARLSQAAVASVPLLKVPTWISAIPPRILRDLCMCQTGCWNHSTQQREAGRLRHSPRHPELQSATMISSNRLQIMWKDTHISEFDMNRLRWLVSASLKSDLPPKISWENSDFLPGGQLASGNLDMKVALSKQYWETLDTTPQTSRGLLETSGGLPSIALDELYSGDGVQNWLGMLWMFGFGLVRGVPCKEQWTDALGQLVGVQDHREMYGRNWRVEVDGGSANDSAFSRDEILPHTDGGYFTEQPHLQLFHCFEADHPGKGRTGLIDGFRVAEDFRKSFPAEFDLLSSVPVCFQFEDASHKWSASHTVIGVQGSPLGPSHPSSIVRITWNNLDRAALPLYKPLEEALRKWDMFLNDPKWEVTFDMAAGDLLLIDNRRVLHSRRGVLSEDSKRVLYGFYMDNDGVAGGLRYPRKLVPKGSVFSPSLVEAPE